MYDFENENLEALGIDPEILAIMNENSATTFGTIYENLETPQVVEKQEKLQAPKAPTTQTNEFKVKTSSIDSEGNVINVGDKVTIGNDKAVGRIIALGKNATVSIQNEGTFDFPCSVLTLVKNNQQTKTADNVKVNIDNHQATLSNETKVNSNQNDKFSSYTIESLIKEHWGKDSLDSDYDDRAEASQRLQEMNDGHPFDMGI